MDDKRWRLAVYVPLGLALISLAWWFTAEASANRWHYTNIYDIPVRIEKATGRIERWTGDGSEWKAWPVNLPVSLSADRIIEKVDAKPIPTPTPEDVFTLEELGAKPAKR